MLFLVYFNDARNEELLISELKGIKKFKPWEEGLILPGINELSLESLHRFVPQRKTQYMQENVHAKDRKILTIAFTQLDGPSSLRLLTSKGTFLSIFSQHFFWKQEVEAENKRECGMTMHFDLSQPWVGNINKIFVRKIFQCFCRFLVPLKTRALIKRVLQQENELSGRTHKDVMTGKHSKNRKKDNQQRKRWKVKNRTRWNTEDMLRIASCQRLRRRNYTECQNLCWCISLSFLKPHPFPDEKTQNTILVKLVKYKEGQRVVTELTAYTQKTFVILNSDYA